MDRKRWWKCAANGALIGAFVNPLIFGVQGPDVSYLVFALYCQREADRG
jgi:hypothetical protein